MSQSNTLRRTTARVESPCTHSPGDSTHLSDSVPAYTQMLELLLSTASDLISFIGPDYVYHWVNEHYLHAFELNQDDVLGRSVADLFGEYQFEGKLKPVIDRAFAGENIQISESFDYPGLGKRFMEVNWSSVSRRD